MFPSAFRPHEFCVEGEGPPTLIRDALATVTLDRIGNRPYATAQMRLHRSIEPKIYMNDHQQTFFWEGSILEIDFCAGVKT